MLNSDVTDSQNPRLVGVGRDLWRSSCPTPLLRQGHPEQLHRPASKWVLNISKDGDSPTSLGNLSPSQQKSDS